MKCKFEHCSKNASKNMRGYCQSCYKYFKTDKIYDLPKEKMVGYAENGKVICHICGKAYRKLGQHIYNDHKMSQIEYRERFKLNHNTKLSSKDYITKMQKYTDIYFDKVVEKNLLENGKRTRVNKGDKLRKNKTHYRITMEINV